jgi:NhaA family Na+:H+ antiporter
MQLTKIFKEFTDSERSGGFVLLGVTIISLILANSSFGEGYIQFFHQHLDLSFWKIQLDYSIEQWINDGLMTIFFLLVGLEIERELYIGELSTFKNALLPILAAIGGMIVPALIHLCFNYGTDEQSGFGIPMATDIAFALGILALAGNRVPASLKIFLTALAIIDDLGAITVIAIFYSKNFELYYLIAALLIFLILFIAGKKKVHAPALYFIGGIIMWYCMLRSGVHPTIAGVLLAFAIPFHLEDNKNPSFRLQHSLHKPVAFIILPVFALANTAIVIPGNWLDSLTTNNSLGIVLGLVLGKFVGIFVASYLAVRFKLAGMAADLNWRDIIGAAFLGGIGFTMSIFITNLAFSNPDTITASKIAILGGSVLASCIGLMILKRKRKNATS